MKKSLLRVLSCPHCAGSVELMSANDGNGEIREGVLRCKACNATFPIENHIPRFVPSQNYAQSFGFQWNKYARTQIDKVSGIDLSRSRFYEVTNWPASLDGQKILEVGCGAGRFTQIAIETGAEVFSFDYSTAVEANLRNNGLHNNVHYFQASLYNIPLKKETFDKVYCFGVLQHCPDVKSAFLGLIPYLKNGGEVVVDVYDLTLRTFINPKYWLRPLTKRLSEERLLYIIQKVVPILYPIRQRMTENIPLIGKYMGFFIPVAFHKGLVPLTDRLTDEQLLEWSILDTFDKFAPEYDKPQRIRTVKKWFEEARLTNIRVNYGPNGINAKGTKP